MALTPTIYELACQAVGADVSRPLPIMHMNEQGHQTGVGALIYYALMRLMRPAERIQGVIN